MWIPGHFHTTVGTGVVLSYLTASLLLIPLLFGRQILSTSAVKVAFVLWFTGIMIFSVGGYISGLAGEPRRTYAPPYLNGVQLTGVHLLDLMKSAATAAMSGAMIFWIGGAILLATLFFSALFGKRVAFSGEVKLSPEPGPATRLDNLKLWIVIGIVLILIAYSLPAVELYSQGLSPAPPQPPLG
jgi:cytochrome c oxidase subunit 1